MAQGWQQKWVTKSPQGASYTRQEHHYSIESSQHLFYETSKILDWAIHIKYPNLSTIGKLRSIDYYDTRNCYATGKILQVNARLAVFHSTRSVSRETCLPQNQETFLSLSLSTVKYE